MVTSVPPSNTIQASTPGRIVLFGEHQDYFNLPVIAAGVSLRVQITGYAHDKSYIDLTLKNLRRTYSIPLKNIPLKYHFRRAYLQSSINLLSRKGFKIPAFKATIAGNIPQNAGLSSSSALTVAWIQFLVGILGEKVPQVDIANWAYEAEVLEFNEPGGPQDHYATALGNIHYFQFPLNLSPVYKPLNLSKFSNSNVAIVIGHSQVRKRTLSMLRRIKYHSFASMRHLGLKTLDAVPLSDIPDEQLHRTLRAIIKIRDITKQGITLLSLKDNNTKSDNSSNDFWLKIGKFLLTQHTVLRDDLRLSVSRIESMINGAMDAGAYGCKINGSGGGGCMIAICHPDDALSVAKGIKKGKGYPYQVSIDSGVRLEKS
ncbi:MAG: GHMP family kinase ATP-binding protein [Candidatus Hodarchaeales archaeon]